MTKWEYEVRQYQISGNSIDLGISQEELKYEGEEGWELCSVTFDPRPFSDTKIVIFKREKVDD